MSDRVGDCPNLPTQKSVGIVTRERHLEAVEYWTGEGWSKIPTRAAEMPDAFIADFHDGTPELDEIKASCDDEHHKLKLQIFPNDDSQVWAGEITR